MNPKKLGTGIFTLEINRRVYVFDNQEEAVKTIKKMQESWWVTALKTILAI